MRKILLAALLLSGCSTLQELTNASLTTNQVYVAANAFDAAEITATNYLRLPACGGTALVCRNKTAVPVIIATVRGGKQARQTLVASCAASTSSPECVSAYQTVTTAVSGLQTTFSQYSVAKGS
jgi:isopentenyl diphosphate isomerase/L-lactate dehydrogenase-like FMN-dependent dehydrogenase